MAVNNILASNLSAHRISREERMSCKCKAVTLVHACLEARCVLSRGALAYAPDQPARHSATPPSRQTPSPHHPTHPTNSIRSSSGVDGPGGSLKVQKDIGASLEPRNVDRFFHTARMYVEDEEPAIEDDEPDEDEVEAVKEEVLAALG